MNQELEQYLRFFIDYRQKNWPEQLASAKFTINNKIHFITKVSLFIANHSRELRMEIDLRRKDTESNGVCREDEKGIGRSRSSI